MICFTLCSTDMNPPHDDYQIKKSTNSLILAMVTASRNCAAETSADEGRSDPADRLHFLRLRTDQETPVSCQTNCSPVRAVCQNTAARSGRRLARSQGARDTEWMSMAAGLAALYSRDLTRLIQELQAFGSDEVLWQRLPGVKNSCGNLILHLEGNLREYIGRQVGGVGYTRVRDREFTLTGVSRDELVHRLEQVKELVTKVVSQLSDGDLAAVHPELVLEKKTSRHELLVNLHGHLNFHLGQIGYLRRILTEGSAMAFV